MQAMELSTFLYRSNRVGPNCSRCEEHVAFQEQTVRVSEMRQKPLLEGVLIQCSVKTPYKPGLCGCLDLGWMKLCISRTGLMN